MAPGIKIYGKNIREHREEEKLRVVTKDKRFRETGRKMGTQKRGERKRKRRR